MIKIDAEEILDELLKRQNYYNTCYYRKSPEGQRCFGGKINDQYEEEFINKKGETKTRSKYRVITCPECKGKGEVPNHTMTKLQALKELLEGLPDV